MSSDNLQQFSTSKYLNLVTYRKNGEEVKTPVWFVINNDTIYIATLSTSGKVKRLNHNKNVRIVPCNFTGNPKGNWIDATAYFANAFESEHVIQLRKKKYGLMAKLIEIFIYKKRKPIVIGIRI